MVDKSKQDEIMSEIIAASEAIAEWFKSLEIGTQESLFIMANVAGMIIANCDGGNLTKSFMRLHSFREAVKEVAINGLAKDFIKGKANNFIKGMK